MNRTTQWLDRAVELQKDAREIFSDGAELEEIQKDIVYNIEKSINLASQAVGLRMWPKEFKAPLTIRQCDNLGSIGGYESSHCWDSEFNRVKDALEHWDTTIQHEPEFLRLIDAHGRIVRDHMDFYDEKRATQIVHRFDATEGN